MACQCGHKFVTARVAAECDVEEGNLDQPITIRMLRREGYAKFPEATADRVGSKINRAINDAMFPVAAMMIMLLVILCLAIANCAMLDEAVHMLRWMRKDALEAQGKNDEYFWRTFGS